MAIPASGAIGISTIRSELDNGGTSSFSLARAGMPYNGYAVRGDGYTPVNQSSTSKPNTTAPYGINEWYSYNHSQNASCNDFFSDTISLQYIYRRVTITGTSGTYAPFYFTISGDSSSYSYYTRIYDAYPFSNTGALASTSPTPLTTIIITGNGSANYWYLLPSSSTVLYFVSWNNSIN